MRRVTLDAFDVVGVELRTDNVAESKQQAIPEIWMWFLEQDIRSTIHNRAEESAIYGVYLDYETDVNGMYSFVLGTRVTEVGRVPEGLVHKSIPEATYVVFEVDGPNDIGKTWQSIWQTDLARTYTGDFEYYDGKGGIVEIYVAVRVGNSGPDTRP